MPFDAPFMLGPFAVDAEGRLAPRDPDAMPDFMFRWRGRLVRARLCHATARHGRLILRTVLGRVPSTADTAAPDARMQSFTALRWLPRSLPACWQLGLLPDHSVLLRAEAEIPLPITASALLGELTGFALSLAPYLDLLESLGVSAGMVKT